LPYQGKNPVAGSPVGGGRWALFSVLSGASVHAVDMTTIIIILTAIPAALATAFDSVGFGLLAVAGGLWAAALGVCSTAPVIAGRRHTVNETVAATLSLLAAGIATLGLAVLFLS
jgi:hypothetical protein